MEKDDTVRSDAIARIMIVDDNEGLANTLSYILQHKGYETLTASSGEDALHIAGEDKNIDIVLMDIKMPLMNGVETYKKLKALLPSAVVIMMTAYAVEDLIEEALKEGAYGVIYKPFDIEHSLKLIQDARSEKSDALIMVVDDDPGTLTTLRNILVKKGFGVITATSGEEAVIRSRENDFDIIFLDMKLPAMNGLETYLRIKELKPDVVAVLITGHHPTMAHLVEEALLASVYLCLQKPLDMAQVLQIINDVLERASDED